MPIKHTYPTTRPGWYDTPKIVDDKRLQQREQANTAWSGLNTRYASTTPRNADTTMITLQKILQKEVEG